jgi:hypothetical protein
MELAFFRIFCEHGPQFTGNIDFSKAFQAFVVADTRAGSGFAIARVIFYFSVCCTSCVTHTGVATRRNNIRKNLGADPAN